MSKIILAEDGYAHARKIVTVLKMNGFDIEWFANGQEALTYILRNPDPALLITDISMPTMCGFELLRQLQVADRFFPKIIITSKNDDEDVKRGFDLGAMDYIIKPLNPAWILTKVKTIVRIQENVRLSSTF